MLIDSSLLSNRYVVAALVALPLLYFAGYLSFLILPIVAREVIPEVVQVICGR